MTLDGTGLKAALDARGMTYETLARQIGVTGGAVQHWAECRNRPAPHRRAAIEAILGPLPGLEAGRRYTQEPRRKRKAGAKVPTVPAAVATASHGTDPLAVLRAELGELDAKLAEVEPLRQRAEKLRQALAILEAP